jgi:UDP-3-O-[3-hydroxymyristoyl] glucosamine N-acyltransferase
VAAIGRRDPLQWAPLKEADAGQERGAGVILRELAARLGCTVRGDDTVNVAQVAGLAEAAPGDLTFLANRRYLPQLADTRASAVIVSADVETPLPSLLSDTPYVMFARAVVDPGAQLGDGVHVGAGAVIGGGVVVGDRTVVHPHVVLYAGVRVGADCVLHSGVHVREGCRLGDRVIVQNGAVIGADGFGFAKRPDARYEKIPQVGIVVVEDDVEIGALTAIDRAALGVTRIGRGTKLDNLVQVGHSVTIGEDTVLAGQVGVAGSTRIGSRVILAGQVGVAGHLAIGDDAVVTAQSGIPGDVPAGSMVSGSPALDNRAWRRAIATFARLPELVRRVRELERARGPRPHQPGGGS